MALNQEQQQLIGLITTIKPVVYTPYLDQIMGNTPFYSSTEMYSFEEATISAGMAGVVPQRAEMPKLVLDGGVVGTIKPDVIGTSFTIAGSETHKTIPGQVVFTPNGAIDNRTNQLTRKLEAQKMASMLTKEAFTAQTKILGTTTMPTSNTAISWGLAAPTSKTVTGGDGFIKWFMQDVIKAYVETNGVAPDEALLNPTHFYQLIVDTKFMDAVKTYGGVFINAGGNNPKEIGIYIGGTVLKPMPRILKYDGTVDTTAANYLHLSTKDVLIPSFGAINFMNDAGVSEWFTGDTFADKELPKSKQTVYEEFFDKSAFFPILTNRNKIKRYALTLS